ncbi:MAG TPA: acetate--CoA ligase family protein [Azospirillum sp.]|nr:acetate--CoA ligase family protein [Azospirillum sp.]
MTAVSIARLLRPRSVAIVGASAEPMSLGGRALGALERLGFAGDIHLINPRRAEIGGRTCLPSVDGLPEGVDAALLAIPQDAILDTVAALIRRKVGAAVVFSSGFAETGEEGLAQQRALADMARAAGLALVGPNCLGLVNFRNRSPLTFGAVQPIELTDRPALAVIAQSGGLMGCLNTAAMARGLPLSYCISTGNEAVLSVEDFLADVIEDEGTGAIAVFVEQLRQPRRFLELAAAARARGKAVVLLHSGRSARSQEAARSHTGAMASDYTVMRTLVESQGVVLVDGMDELMDTAELLTRFATVPAGGTAVITDSGAFKGLALDFGEAIGLDMPEPAAATKDALATVMPGYTELSNPLDVTGQGLRDPKTFYGDPVRIMAADPRVGSVLMSALPGNPAMVLSKIKATADAAAEVGKPVVAVVMGGESAFPAEIAATARAAGIPYFRSPEHAMRALANVARYGRLRAACERRGAVAAAVPPLPGAGTLPEYVGKRWLADAGLPVPAGALARTAEEACAVAARIGYPVVLKAQAAALTHKSDVGGVAVGLADEAALRAAWARMHDAVGAALPDLTLDGILVEAMGARGLELVLGARRDPQWGPVLMVGLGGIWIEALKDVRFLPADATEDAVRAELARLQGAALLRGLRGSPAVDVDAVARAVVRLGQLVLATPSLTEVDVNPLVAYPAGEGVLVLDALVVSDEDAGI